MTKKNISVHRPKHKYPQTENEWGAYLSGYVDGGNRLYLGERVQLSYDPPRINICFNDKDFSLAYKLKKFIGYGTVSKKKGLNYNVTSGGHEKICRILIHLQKFYNQQRFAEFCDFYDIKVNSQPHTFCVFDSHWLAGFIDAGGDLDLLIGDQKDDGSGPIVNLSLIIDQPLRVGSEDLLLQSPQGLIAIEFAIALLLKEQIGGTVKFDADMSSVSYCSNSLSSAQKLITYLDKYHLCSNKYKEYVIWRRAFFYETDIETIKCFQKRLKTLKDIPKI